MIDPVSSHGGRAALDLIDAHQAHMNDAGPGPAPMDAVQRFEAALDGPSGAGEQSFQVAQAEGADMWVRSPSPAEVSPAAMMAPPDAVDGAAAADPWLRAPDPADAPPPPVNFGDALAERMESIRDGWDQMTGVLDDPALNLEPGQVPDASMIVDMFREGMTAQMGMVSFQMVTHEISTASGTVSQLLKMQ